MSKDKFLSAAKSDGFGFCSVIFGWDSELARFLPRAVTIAK